VEEEIEGAGAVTRVRCSAASGQGATKMGRHGRRGMRPGEEGGWGPAGQWGPVAVKGRGRKKTGARGPAQEKEKRAGPINFLIHSKRFQMSSNYFDQRVNIPCSKNFK
jgi:hypothetical protein